MTGVDHLELYRPPDGYRFVAGVVATHDLDWTFVVDQIAPALTGVITTGRRRRLETRAALEVVDPALLVLHSTGASFVAGPVLPWAAATPVGGRRQHAKATVLQFRSTTRRGELGNKWRTRAIVGSANLTRHGFRTNRELLVWDEIAHSSTRPFFGRDLIRALAELPAGDHTHGDDLRRLLRALRKRVKGAGSVGGLRSSIGEAKPVVPQTSVPSERIVVVSPSFAAASETFTGDVLAKRCTPHTQVDVFTGHRGTYADAAAGSPGLTWPASMLDRVRATGAAVTVHAVPEAGDPARRLHAKLVAFDRGDDWWIEVWTGSANCTRPGLAGRNRELMLCQWWSRARLRQLLDGLDAVPFEGPIDLPGAATAGERVPRSRARLRFEIDPGCRPDSRQATGTWILEGAEAGVSVEYLGQTIPSGRSPGVLDLERGSARVLTASGVHMEIVIDVDVPEGGPGFWGRFTIEAREDRHDPSLLRLLGDVERARRPAPDGPGVKKVSGDDRFAIPLRQRSVLLVRHRRRLSELPDRAEIIDAMLTDELHGETTSSRQVVGAVLSAYEAKSRRSPDELLAALADAVGHLDQLADEEGGA